MGYYEKLWAKINVAAALAEMDWNLYDYKPRVWEPETDFHSDGSWSGIATHADFPGLILVVMPNSFTTVVEQQEGLLEPGKAKMPPFTMVKKGMSWHIERSGEILKQGRLKKEVYTAVDKQKACRDFVIGIEALMQKLSK